MWEVKLLGSDDDLKMLTESFGSGDTSIVSLEETFFLRSASFEGMETAEEVRARAMELATSISGLARLTLKSPEPLRLGAVHQRREDGTRGTTIFPQTVGLRLRAFPATVTGTRADGSIDASRPADRAREWLAVVEKNEAVRRAVRLRNEGSLDWVGLYRLYEVILADVGGELFGWVSKTRIERFKRTANSVAAVGDQARHGKEESDPPEDPMPLLEAQGLLDGLMEKWISSKTATDE